MLDDKIDDIFIIPDEEKQLRIQRKEQLRLRKEKNKELRSRIARSKAIEKSEQKRTVKNNKNDIDDLKEQLRKIRESNSEQKILTNNNDEKNVENVENNNINIEPPKIEKKEISKSINYDDPTIKKAEKMIKDVDDKVEKQKLIQVLETPKLIEPPQRVINPKLFRRRF